MIDLRYRRGIFLPDHDLWLDPWDEQPFAFVSHAHADHIGNHAEIIASAGTARLMDARLPGKRREHVLEFGQTATIRDFNITLLPAGHIFGSAQSLVETEAGSLLYTGDFKLRPGLSAEPTEWRHADTLIMETTYGLPKYRMPPTEVVIDQMLAFCREALDEGAVPVLLGYSLGKSQEILCALMQNGFTPMLHGAVHRMTEIYRQLRPDFPTNYERYSPGRIAGKVIVCPPSAARSLMIQRIKNRRTAVLTGWALDSGAKFRYGCDAAFALTDHADYDDLVRYVELVQPKRVLTLHGFAAAFARDLRQRGIEAWALSQENQLELRLDSSNPGKKKPRMTRMERTGDSGANSAPHEAATRADASLESASGDASLGEAEAGISADDFLPQDDEASDLATSATAFTSDAAAFSPFVPSAPSAVENSPLSPVDPASFRAFAEIGEQIAATTSKLKKIELLGGYLAQLGARDGQLLAIATIYLTGRPFSQTDARALQTGWAVIQRALIAVSGMSEDQVRETARLHSDAGKTTYEVLLDTAGSEPFPLAESRAFFEVLQRTRGPIAKTELLQRQLARLSALEASYLVRILTGDFRIGLKEGLVEEAVAAAFGAEPDDVREANMLTGDLGEVAVLASRRALDEATLHLFRPIKCMLASPEQTAVALWSRLTENVEREAWSVERSTGEAPGESSAPLFPMQAEEQNADSVSDVPDGSGASFGASGTTSDASRPASQAPRAFWVEDKYDGIRAQLHVGEGRAELFSRDLKNVTEQFAEVARAARPFPRRAIFDGEVLAFAAGRKLTFFDLQKRLGRKTEDDLFLGSSDIPVIYKAFDLLSLDGESLLREPLHRRRALLETLTLTAGLEIAATIAIASPDDIEAAVSAARARGNEGLIAKDATSLYKPGRRGLAWLKLKKELATLDVVVIGAETGHGKRSGVLSDYTFAVRDEASGALLTIGKAYSGVFYVEVAMLTEHFTATTLAQRGKYREVRPEIVFEIAFDSIQPSSRHSSGLALRFPRIKAIRRDKTPAEADTLAYARSLMASGGLGLE